MSLAKTIPNEIMANIFTYTPNIVFCQALTTNKEISAKLQDDLYQRLKKKVLQTLLNDHICLSNLTLGEYGNFRCESKKDRNRGSSFCSFCHHVMRLR